MTGSATGALSFAATGAGSAPAWGAAQGTVTFTATATGEWTSGVDVATFAADLPSVSDLDLAMLRSAVLAELQRRAVLANGVAQIVNLTNAYQQALGSSPAPVPWEPGVGSKALYGPGVLVTYKGATYRNTSNAVLNGNYTPSSSSPWWTAIPQTGAATPWAAGMPLTPGELVSDPAGAVWRYNGNPIPSAPANWAPANNATWTQISPA